MAEERAETEIRTYQPGDIIFREGDPSRGEAYLIHEGTVEARRQMDGEDRLLNTLGHGDLLGEVALFRGGPHSVTATAKEHVKVLVIPADRLENMARANSELAIGLIRQLARMAAGEKSEDTEGSARQ
jgi:CRP/FNR family transcriptional regulator, cyclic AMP receptor protein